MIADAPATPRGTTTSEQNESCPHRCVMALRGCVPGRSEVRSVPVRISRSSSRNPTKPRQHRLPRGSSIRRVRAGCFRDDATDQGGGGTDCGFASVVSGGHARMLATERTCSAEMTEQARLRHHAASRSGRSSASSASLNACGSVASSSLPSPSSKAAERDWLFAAEASSSVVSRNSASG